VERYGTGRKTGGRKIILHRKLESRSTKSPLNDPYVEREPGGVNARHGQNEKIGRQERGNDLEKESTPANALRTAFPGGFISFLAAKRQGGFLCMRRSPRCSILEKSRKSGARRKGVATGS